MKNISSLLFLTILCLTTSNLVFSQATFSDYFKQGETAFTNSDFEKSTLFFQRAISAFGGKDDSIQLGESYLHMGMIYGKLEDYTSSEKYVVHAKQIFEKLKNDSMLIRTYNLLGNLLAVNHKTDEALKTYNNSLRLAIASGLLERQGSILNNIGVLYYNQKKYHEAIQQYEKGFIIAAQIKSKYGMSLSLINTGISYQGLGNPGKAIAYIKEGIEKAKEINDLYQLQIGYEQISNAYFSTGNFKEAYNYLNLFTMVKDSISSIEIHKQITAQEAKFQSQQKELEIAKLKTEKQKNEIGALESENKIKSLQYTLGIIFSIFLVIIIVSVLFYKQYKNKVKLTVNLEQSKNDLERKNSDLSSSLLLNDKLQSALRQDLDNYKQLAYRKQMNPHFIFNSLNAIQNYILTNNKLEANYYLGELSTLIRRILENSEKDVVSLKEELLVSETYIKLEQKRFVGKFNYTLECDEEIEASKIKIPPLLLQPFIENAIWHGLLHKPENALLQIGISKTTGGEILISIKDNGVGRNSKNGNVFSEAKMESMGINLTLNRINLSNCITEDKIILKIKDLFDNNQKPGGTEVLITLQQQLEHESIA